MAETCENCGNRALPPRGWTDWTCAECGHTQGDEIPDGEKSIDDLLDEIEGDA